MQNQKRTSAVRSEKLIRYSYPGTCNANPLSLNFLSNRQVQKPKVDVEKTKPDRRRLSNTSNASNSSNSSNSSSLSHDSGVGFSKADYEIQRALRAQRGQRPYIIVIRKGKPISHAKSLDNDDEFEANIVVAAATASKRHRREISVMQKRQTIDFNGNDDAEKFGHNYSLNSNSAPNLLETPKTSKRASKRSSIMPKPKLFKSVSISLKRFMGMNKETNRRSQLIQRFVKNQDSF